MPGFERILDPISRDYVSDGRGGNEKTRSARTRVFHRLQAQYARWWGDVEHGSRLYEFQRANDSADTVRALKAAVEAALQPLVEAQFIADLVVEIQRDQVGREFVYTTMRDVQTGEEIDATDLVRFKG